MDADLIRCFPTFLTPTWLFLRLVSVRPADGKATLWYNISRVLEFLVKIVVVTIACVYVLYKSLVSFLATLKHNDLLDGTTVYQVSAVMMYAMPLLGVAVVGYWSLKGLSLMKLSYYIHIQGAFFQSFQLQMDPVPAV